MNPGRATSVYPWGEIRTGRRASTQEFSFLRFKLFMEKNIFDKCHRVLSLKHTLVQLAAFAQLNQQSSQSEFDFFIFL